MINRRKLVLASAVGLAAPLVRPARAAPRLRLGIGHGTKANYGAAAVAMAEGMRARTNGRVEIEIFADSVLGSEETLLTAVRNGTLDLAIVASGLLGSYAPEVGLLDMPFLFRDAAHAQAVLDGPIGQEYAALSKTAGTPVLAWAENGLRHLTANRALHSAADLKGLKLRIMSAPVLLESFRAMGADASELPVTLLYEALRVGNFDAEENPTAVILASKLYEVQSHLMLTGHTYSAACIAVSPDLLEDLSASDQEALAASARDGAAASRAFAVAAGPDEMKRLEACGMTIIADVDRASFQQAAEKAYLAMERRFGTERISRLRAA